MRDPEDIIDGEVTAEDVVTETPAEPEPERRVARTPRTSSPLSRQYSADSPLAPAIDNLERTLGGRQAFIDAVVGLPDSAGLDYVVGLLADPRSDARKLSAICYAGGVSLGELLEAFKRGLLITPTLTAMRHVAARLPDVVEDVMLRAAPHEVRCGACDGLTTVAGPTPDSAPIPCAACKGRGSTYVLPDLETQKVALQLAGLGPRGGPTTVVQVDNRKQAAFGSMSDLIRATDAVALRPRPRTTADAVVPNRAAPGPAEAGPAVDSSPEDPSPR